MILKTEMKEWVISTQYLINAYKIVINTSTSSKRRSQQKETQMVVSFHYSGGEHMGINTQRCKLSDDIKLLKKKGMELTVLLSQIKTTHNTAGTQVLQMRLGEEPAQRIQ